MTSKDASLYGIQRPKHGPSQKDIASSSTLAFTSHLSSLISKDAASATPSSSSSSKSKSDGGSYTFTRGRARPSKSAKPDLFSVHNKGALKRAAKDEAAGEDYDILGSGNPRQVHQNSENIGAVDAITLQRSKRRMEEKADLYENLRKGHHLADGSSSDEDEVGDDYMSRLRRKERNALVDFDRKWAEDEEKITREEDDDDDGIGPLVDYEDEFGRARRGTRAEAAQAARLRRHTQGGTTAADDEEDPSRPARPSNLIYGETIQTHAFNPDTAIASQMAYLASKRDRSATPPESLHYDAEAEVRTRGTGFYKFSQDAKEREQEMHDLLNVRRETEREREERGQRKAERDRAKEERRAKIRELRGKRQADRFLDGLGVPV